MKLKRKDEKYLYIKRNWCKQCNFCVEFCPHDVFELDEDAYPYVAHLDKCTECGLCIALCPDFAIIAKEEIVEELKER